MTTHDAVTEAARTTGVLGRYVLFLVWGPPSHGPRSRVFARELGIDVRFVTSTARRGPLVAPFKYASQTYKTVRLLAARRPRLVFVQSPPTFAVMTVWLYSAFTGGRFIVDAHSAAMLSAYWTRPRWLYRLIARRAVATIVTNEHFAGSIRRSGGRALVIRDIPASLPADDTSPVPDAFNVMVVNSFADDEPLAQVIAAADGLNDVVFHVTGDPGRPGARVPDRVPGNVRFTGFLPERAYHGLMASSQAVLCLTTRDHTMQRGACEALWMGKPIVTSRWPLLQEYFRAGAVHVANTSDGIRDGVRELMRRYPEYEEGIRRLQGEQRDAWERSLRSLLDVVASAPARPGAGTRTSEGSVVTS
jgi:glycosyltransferase involved in cell wall biosynthesis